MHYHLNHNPHQFFTYHLILDEKHVLTCAKLSSFLAFFTWLGHLSLQA